MTALANPRLRRWLFGVACVLAAILFASRGLGDESYVSTHGDPPRYMMNAMFILDMLRDWPFGSLDEVRNWATLYYARYPALSLGHHPPLISVVQVPFLALLGPSIATARVAMILTGTTGVLFLYLLVSDIYDEWAGLVAGLVLAASPSLIYETQASLSDPTAVALTVMAAYYLHRFCETNRRSHLALFALTAALSVYAKPNAVAAFPALLVYGWVRLGWRRLFRADMLAAAAFIGISAGAFIGVTVAISSFNTERSSALFRSSAPAAQPAPAAAPGPEATSPAPAQPAAGGWTLRRAFVRVVTFTPYTLSVQLSAGAAAVCVGGFVLLLSSRRPEAWLFGVWAVTTYVLVVLLTQRVEMERYGAYWLPPLAASAGYLAVLARRSQRLGTAIGLVLALALGTEAIAGAAVRVHGLSGYEEAARYVQAHPRGSSVLFSGDFDSGYFIFFTRKHDPDRRSIVLRSDKIFTVSMMQQVSVAELIDRPDLIAPTLGRLGVGYVVIEDRASSSRVLEWLRDEVRTDRYVERLRTRIDTRDRRIQQTDVVVYEVKDVSAPDPDARLDLRLPLISKNFDVRLADLLTPAQRP